MIIDARLRPATESYLHSTVYNGHAYEFHKRFGVGMAPSVREKSLELCLQEMDEARIDLGLAPARWGAAPEPYVTPEEVAQIMADYPNRFYGAIALDTCQLRRSMELIEKWVVNGPVKAVCLEPGRGPKPMYFNDARIYPMYDYLQEKNIPVFIMAGGMTGPDVSYSDPVYLDRMLNDFPKLTVINIHGGVPYVDQSIFCALRHPNLFLCPDMYLNHTAWWRRYIDAANCMIQDQFLFGSSYPFVPMKEGLDIFNSFPLREEVRDKVMYKNAARALGIDPEDYRRF